MSCVASFMRDAISGCLDTGSNMVHRIDSTAIGSPIKISMRESLMDRGFDALHGQLKLCEAPIQSAHSLASGSLVFSSI